jgi:hypothetical protein
LGGFGGEKGVKHNSFNSNVSMNSMVLMDLIDTLRGMTGIGYDKEREIEEDEDGFTQEDYDNIGEDYD